MRNKTQYQCCNCDATKNIYIVHAEIAREIAMVTWCLMCLITFKPNTRITIFDYHPVRGRKNAKI